MSNSLTVTELDRLEGLDSAKRMIFKLGRDLAPSHAVLFYGMEGSGKTSLASALTNAWLCKNPDRSPCGQCQPCGAFQRGTAADILRIDPDGPAGIIRITHIRPNPEGPKKDDPYSMQEFLRTGPLAARNKVVVIERLDRLNSSAANALLKTLEEPPQNTKIVMTTSYPGQILPTIFSRCLAIRCELPELHPPADLEPELLASTSGSPGLLAEILEQLEWRREWLNFVKALGRMDRRDALRASDTFRALSEKGPRDGVRFQTAYGLEIFTGLYRGSIYAQEAIVEAHRRLMGNGSAALILDALFAKILGEPGRGTIS